MTNKKTKQEETASVLLILLTFMTIFIAGMSSGYTRLGFLITTVIFIIAIGSLERSVKERE